MKRTPKALNDRIGKLLDEAHNLAMQEVERMARQIMREHPNLQNFVMAMGCATFTEKGGGRDADLGLDDRAYFKPLDDFINEWDSQLGLTGDPIWIEGPDGIIVREWGATDGSDGAQPGIERWQREQDNP